MRILIAQDDAALAGFVRKGLEAEHYAVDVSADGEQARALANEFDYTLVVLDLNLPRLDGVAILKDVRSRKTDLPILNLTARERVADRVQCLDSGADDYLVKPSTSRMIRRLLVAKTGSVRAYVAVSFAFSSNFPRPACMVHLFPVPVVWIAFAMPIRCGPQ